MKALIFNSGTGSRMGELTKNRPKCLMELPDGETILSRQLRILSGCGITEVVVTTGKYTALIAEEARKFGDLRVTIVENPKYAETNYIYSMHLAAAHLDDDILMLHGDLVFDREVVMRLLESAHPDACAVSFEEELPKKDFKGRVIGGKLREVSVSIFGDDCHALQPMYKLSGETISLWSDKVREYAESGNTQVYAENALNELLDGLDIMPVSYDGCFIREIDTEEDYLAVGSEIILRDIGCFTDTSHLPELVKSLGAQLPFVIVGRHFEAELRALMGENGCVFYTNYRENPDAESIRRAADTFVNSGCDLLISVGGGSVIDTAKGVKYSIDLNIPHIAVPTTAGSGSEATQFAVYYKDGKKQSLDAPELLPDHVIADSSMLVTLDRRKRAVTLLDALCHAAESLMSVGATDESRRYSRLSIAVIRRYFGRWLCGDDSVKGMIMTASHYSGRAINISRTAAGHAMSYVLTSRFGIRHGETAAVCLKNVMTFLSGRGELSDELADVSELLSEVWETADLSHAGLLDGVQPSELSGEVNTERLRNSAYPLTECDILDIYDMVIDDLKK